MQQNDAPVLHEKPQHARIELANVAQFKKPFAKRFGERLSAAPLLSVLTFISGPIPGREQAGQPAYGWPNTTAQTIPLIQEDQCMLKGRRV